VLESPVHTQLIPAIWLEFATRKGGVQHVGVKGNVGGSHQSSEWKVAKHVWLNLDWLNARPSGATIGRQRKMAETLDQKIDGYVISASLSNSSGRLSLREKRGERKT
jgi:hypothetical protein